MTGYLRMRPIIKWSPNFFYHGSVQCIPDLAALIGFNLFAKEATKVRKKSKMRKGAQWLSGRVLDSRPKGSGFEPHWRHCAVVLEQDTFILA